MTIGLTGGIGSGKSTVAEILRQLGATVIDADKIGHEVYEPGTEGWFKVVDAFGREILSAGQTIDRKRLGAIVFANANQLARLNAIVHPLIAARTAERIAKETQSSSGGAVVVEAAVLIEAGWVSLVDLVWLVTASKSAVEHRLATHRGLDRAAIEARIGAQLSDDERRRHADVIIENDGTLDDLRRQVTCEWRRVCPSP